MAKMAGSAKKPSRKAIIRAIASSTAIETGQNIRSLELALARKNSRFAQLKLAD